MPIFDDLSKKLSNVAQSTVAMSKELAGNAKASFAINSEEHEIDRAYKAIGRWYYENRGDDQDAIAGELDIVETSLRKISEIQDAANEAKETAAQPPKRVNCPGCGAEMDAGTKFCPECRAMMLSETDIMRAESVCSNCGCVTNGPFCSQCGAKVAD